MSGPMEDKPMAYIAFIAILFGAAGIAGGIEAENTAGTIAAAVIHIGGIIAMYAAARNERKEGGADMQEEYGLQVIAEGSFTDEGYSIRTVTIRLNGAAMDGYIMSGKWNIGDVYETSEEYKEYIRKKELARKEWEKKILGMLGIEAEAGYSITRALSEIFTVVQFRQDKPDAQGDEPC